MTVAFLVIFNILFLLTCWAYARIVLTPPGYAKDVRPRDTSRHDFQATGLKYVSFPLYLILIPSLARSKVPTAGAAIS